MGSFSRKPPLPRTRGSSKRGLRRGQPALRGARAWRERGHRRERVLQPQEGRRRQAHRVLRRRPLPAGKSTPAHPQDPLLLTRSTPARPHPSIDVLKEFVGPILATFKLRGSHLFPLLPDQLLLSWRYRSLALFSVSCLSLFLDFHSFSLLPPFFWFGGALTRDSCEGHKRDILLSLHGPRGPPSVPTVRLNVRAFSGREP